MSPELDAAINERDRLARVIANYVQGGLDVPDDLIHAYRAAKFSIVDVIHHPSCPFRTQHMVSTETCACREVVRELRLA